MDVVGVAAVAPPAEDWPCGLVTLSADWRITSANRWFCSALGRAAADLIGHEFTRILPVMGRIYHETHFAPLLLLQSYCSEVAIDFLRADGTRLATLVNAVTTPEVPNGPPAIRLVVFEARDRRLYERELVETQRSLEARNRDLDHANATLAHQNLELERLAREAAAARADAEAANATKSRFLASLSHEIRTPLNGVIGVASALRKQVDDPYLNSLVGVIEDAGDVLLRVVNDSLDLARIEAGRLDLETERVDLRELMRKIAQVHALRAEEHGLALTVTLAQDADLLRLGDDLRLQQILHNLIGNALKFTESGGVTVWVAGRTDEPLVLQVRDTGIGMTPEQLARLFDPFVQAEVSTSRRFGGSGLGMSIVQELVRAMGGTISADSQPGQGTTVTVSLPLPPVRRDSSARTRATDDPAPTLDGLRILAAEDNRTNQLVLRLMLQDVPIDLTVVNDGAEAVEACRADRFDLLLLDVLMPVMDGPTALRTIRAEETAAGRPPVPAIAVTANALRHQIEELLAGGFVAHVAKPLRREKLLEQMQRAVAACRRAT